MLGTSFVSRPQNQGAPQRETEVLENAYPCWLSGTSFGLIRAEPEPTAVALAFGETSHQSITPRTYPSSPTAD